MLKFFVQVLGEFRPCQQFICFDNTTNTARNKSAQFFSPTGHFISQLHHRKILIYYMVCFDEMMNLKFHHVYDVKI